VAPGLGAALAISAALGVLCSVAGFAAAYRVDLPTGPTSVALAAACWLAASGATRLFSRGRRAKGIAAVLLAALSLAGPPGCGSLFGPREEPALPRGSLPADLSARGPVVVARLRNDTGEPLRIAGWNPLKEMERAVGASDEPAWTVADALQQRAVHELARRGVAVLDFEADRRALPDVPTDAQSAARSAREADIVTPVLFGRLRRFTLTQTGLLLVRLELELLDPASGEVLWTGQATRPVPVKSALTAQEVVLDAGPAIFAEAFGND
jgi:hypothetical protein